MVRDARERGPSGEEDPDYIDFAWVKALVRRLGRRMFAEPEPTEAAMSGKGPSGGLAPDPTSTREQASSTPVGSTAVSEPDDAVPQPAPDSGQEAGPLSPVRRLRASERYRMAEERYRLPVTMVFLIGVISMINHFSGHDWGDDFALYMRQAKALTIGNMGEVIADNRFTVDNSGWHTFSPYSYPWGWPLLVAPFYAVFGLHYELFKFLVVVAFCVFLLAFFAIVRRRAGVVPATILTLLIGLSPSYVGATDTVLSDVPYLGFVGLSLWWMDRCGESGILNASRGRLVVLGLLLAYTYNVRREGLIVVFALVALHGAALAGVAVRAGSKRALRQVKWKEVSLPYVTFAAAVATLQLLLPTALLRAAPAGPGLSISGRIEHQRHTLAQQVGLEDPGNPMQLLGSQAAAKFALALLVILAVVGLVGRLLYRFEEDITLAAYLCFSSFLVLSLPVQEGRYLLTITPLLVYFAYQALPTMARLATASSGSLVRIASFAPALALAGLVALNARDLAHATNYHLDYHYIVNGPERPEAQQMFAAVRETTRADDVILFFRARAMTLYTDRKAIMGADLDRLLKRADWYVMEKGSTYSQKLLSDDQAAEYGLAKTWENSGWVIWRVPPQGA